MREFSNGGRAYVTQPPVNLGGFSVISLAFDDGYESVFTVAYPLLEKYNFRGTACIITDKVGTKGRITQDQIEALVMHGWEIGSHTVSHPYLPIIALWDKVFGTSYLDMELGKAQDILDAEGFCIPFGYTTNFITSKIADYYKYARGANTGVNDLTNLHPFDLKTFIVHNWNSLKTLKSWAAKAKNDKAWVIFTFHDFNSFTPYFSGCKGELFRKLIAHVAGLGIRVETVKNVVEGCNPNHAKPKMWRP